MNVIACLTFVTLFSINACLAQTAIDQDTNGAVGFFAPALSGAIASAQSEFEPSVATSTDPPSQVASPNVETTASTPQTFATTSTVPPTSATTSTASSHSSTASSKSSSSSSTTSTAKASSTDSVAKPTSPIVSPGHHSSTKIGIGVGVPLGIALVAIVGFLTLRHRRYKQDSRLRHHGIIAAAGLYPAIDEADDRVGETDQTNLTDVENRSESQGHEKNDVHEIQGTEIPPYSRELIGSPGMPRQELALRRGSV